LPELRGPRVGAAVQAALTMGYRSTGKVSTPPSPSGWLHRHLSWAPPLASGWACAGFTVVCAVDTPHDGPSMGGLPVWTARSRRTHQRNDLAHVPGRDAPDVLRTDGTFPISSRSASAQQPSGRGSQGRAAGVGLKSVFSIACMITASFRARPHA
jgi:hypothetical protein